MNTIELFVPYRFEKKLVYENEISKTFEHKAMYVSKGRYAIVHILKSYGITEGNIGISAYMCPSVKETLQKKGYNVVYYDVDFDDLNANFHSVKNLIESKSLKAVVVASLYGNPANLVALEELCREKNIILIDDAAQAFGAVLDGRHVGSFGDGGFFSFSPGKPTAAHRGGYFWTRNEYEIKRSRHAFSAFVAYKSFYYRRYLAYEKHPIQSVVWSFLYNVLLRVPINTENDHLEEYEKWVLGGVFDASLNEAKDYRNKWIQRFKDIKTMDGCFLLQPIRGDCSNSCKLVYVFNNIANREEFAEYLRGKSISYYGGYTIPIEADYCENAKNVEGKIIELPIDYHEDKMEYLEKCVTDFFVRAIENNK